nr:reverse transcriptase domain-containing protein [Tanacetum cinerariifolium]
MPWAWSDQRSYYSNIFYHGLDEPTQGILNITAGGIFLYKSPNQAFQFLEDKVLFTLDLSTKSQNKHHRKYVSFADGSDSNTDNSRLIKKMEALIIKMDSQFQSLKEEMHEMHKNYNHEEENASRNHLNDDTPIDDGKPIGVLPNKESKTVNQEP